MKKRKIKLEAKRTGWLLAAPLLFAFCQPLLAQVPLGPGGSSNQNYVMTTVYRQPFTTAPASPTTAQAMRDITYYDGLGRPLQQVQVKASGGTGYMDLVTPVAYDAFGRQILQYLPYATLTGAGGTFKTGAVAAQAAYYSGTPPAGQSANSHPFSRTVYEASPLNRVLEQGSPGAVWQPADSRTAASGRTVAAEQAFNNTVAYTSTATTRQVSLYRVSLASDGTPTLLLDGVYGANQLYVSVTKDENWNGGSGTFASRLHTVEQYTDKQGQVVLSRTFNLEGATQQILSTYYVYNDLGQLAYVLTPATDPDRTGSSPPTAAQLAWHGYTYRYDGRGRMVEKQLPAKGTEYLLYNKLDRLVATQDAVQRAASPQQWTYYKYDAHGREVMSGRHDQNGTRAAVQATVDATGVQWEDRHASNPSGYTNTSFPSGGGIEVYQYSYYDTYAIPGIPSAYSPAGFSALVHGLPTSTRSLVLGTTDYLWTVLCYDDHGRITREYRQHYLGGGPAHPNNYDELTHSYSFAGELLETVRRHMGTGSPALKLTLSQEYTYDHRGRPLDSWNTVNAGIRTLLARPQRVQPDRAAPAETAA